MLNHVLQWIYLGLQRQTYATLRIITFMVPIYPSLLTSYSRLLSINFAVLYTKKHDVSYIRERD